MRHSILLCKVKMIFYPNFHSIKYGLKWLEFGLYSYFCQAVSKMAILYFWLANVSSILPIRQVIKTKESQSLHLASILLTAESSWAGSEQRQ